MTEVTEAGCVTSVTGLLSLRALGRFTHEKIKNFPFDRCSAYVGY
jgi:hypothetical protein